MQFSRSTMVSSPNQAHLVASITIVVALCFLTPQATLAAGKQGEFLQTDTFGMSMATRDFTAHRTTTVADAANLSEFVGLHLYVLDRWRMGMNLQFTEQLAPSPAPGTSRFRAFALLPQIGCNFYDPFFASLIYKIAPRTGGESRLDMAIQGLLGVGLPLSSRIRLTFAVEAPFAFYIHRTLGVTVLSGISIRL